MLQTLPRQSNTMQNTFKVTSIDATDYTNVISHVWSSDQLLAQAITYRDELSVKYPHLIFSVRIDYQNAFSY